MTDKITIGDCRAAGYCVKGVRNHCDLLGLDFRKLVKEGLLISDVEHINDSAVQRSLEKARERISKRGS